MPGEKLEKENKIVTFVEQCFVCETPPMCLSSLLEENLRPPTKVRQRSRL